MMSFLLIICVTFITLSMNFSPAFLFHSTYGNYETDRLALLEFRSKLYYDQDGALGMWNHSDHCSWLGITCNRERSRRVTALDLSNRVSFGASIAPDIGNLTFLMTLRLGSNSLPGEIPQEIGRLSRLQYLDLSDNELSGEIPSSLKNCLHLKYLYLSGNNLIGEVPPSLQSLKGIQEFDLSGNDLSGPVPEYLKSFLSLKKLDMSHNQLHGEIPSSLKNCLNLTALYLNNNNLEGIIPSSLQSLKGLEELVLGNNLLSGPIPGYLKSFQSIYKLDLSDNKLSGEIPHEIGSLFRLQYLDLSYNHLSGEIPSSLGKCVDLKGLYLNSNNLTGVIPPSFQSLRGIQELILASNNLSGPIPGYLKSFPFLKKLDLSFNKFEGEVPKEGVFNNTRALISFYYYGNDKLCGGNPLLQLPSCPGTGSRKLLLILSGVVICVIISGSFAKYLWRRKARIKTFSCESPVSDMLEEVSYKPASSESLFSNMFHKVSYKELLKATNGFSSRNLVGVGGYGSVYIGIAMLSQEITAVVAVKVLNLQRRGALKSFKAECEVLRCIRHRNVMKILTSCSSVDCKGNEFKALVYEYMPNGSLENWLHPAENNGKHQRSTNRPLKFIERLNIAIDVASALDYLHRQCQTPIAHCDLKPSNVLLDEDMNGHLGDFGSAKFLRGLVTVNVESGNNCSTSLIRGSIGYVAPEYGMGRAVSTNGDFYSFGIMLLELFTGRRPTDKMFRDGLTLHSFAKTALATDRVMVIVDPTLVVFQNDEDNYEKRMAKLSEALTEIFRLGVTCCIESPKERLEMVLVVKELQSIKNMYVS